MSPASYNHPQLSVQCFKNNFNQRCLPTFNIKVWIIYAQCLPTPQSLTMLPGPLLTRKTGMSWCPRCCVCSGCPVWATWKCKRSHANPYTVMFAMTVKAYLKGPRKVRQHYWEVASFVWRIKARIALRLKNKPTQNKNSSLKYISTTRKNREFVSKSVSEKGKGENIYIFRALK